MNNTLNPDWLHWPQTQTLVDAFPPHSLRFVGGAVRDALLEREVYDVDAATTLLPDEVMRLLGQNGIHAIPTGIAHGTVTARIDGKSFEITTLRKDVSTDGRHAEVAFTDDWKTDASRRDFTINALYLSPEGELFDYFSGIEDAKAGRVCFIGDPQARIQEDYLRILRYFRFLAQMGFPAELHRPSYEACKELAAGIEKLSGERIRLEMFKLLALPDLTDDVFMWLSKSGVEEILFPCRIVTHCKTLIPLEREFKCAPGPMRRLCMCLSDADAISFTNVSTRWKLSNHQVRRLKIFQDHYPAIKSDVTPAKIKQLKRKVGETILTDLVLVGWATGGEKYRTAFAPMLDIALHWPVPEFPVMGQDLLDAGMAAGEAVGKVLKEMEQAWEESGYGLTREELLKLFG